MKYKVGDRVKIKSLDWYNENSDDGYSVVFADGWHFSEPMSIFCGKELIIENISHAINPPHYMMKDNAFGWTDEMIEGLVQDENNPLTENVVDTVRESNDRYRIVIDSRFDIEVDEGEYYAVRRKKEYPKTFVEVLDFWYPDRQLEDDYQRSYKKDLIKKFQDLLYARDAYWKIAGEEMGLGKPWGPDWTYNGATKYCIGVSENEIQSFNSGVAQYVFAFPTPEMRDAFKENFDPDIEFCKELL